MSLLAALVSLLLSPLAAKARNPPLVYPEWLLVGLASTGAMVLALWCSSHYSTRWYTRSLLGGAIVLALLALGTPLESYYSSFHDYPWGVAIPLALALILGGWRSHQRWLPVLLLAFLIYWFHGAALPPATRTLPTRITVDDLTVTVQSLERRGFFGRDAGRWCTFCQVNTFGHGRARYN